MGIFLGNLPIELKIVSNQVRIIPRYFPYDDNFFGKIYYKADQLYLCLEIEDPRHKFVIRHKRRKIYFHADNSDNFYEMMYKKKLHTKFYGIYYWEISTSNLNNQYTYNLNDIYNYYNKYQGYQFKIRATYRYDYKAPKRQCRDVDLKMYQCNKTRTNVFSNEIRLELPYNNRP